MMPRKTTMESLNMVQTGNERVDRIMKEILMGICERKILMEKQEPYDDDEYHYEEYYGEFKDLGITTQKRRSLGGINPRYILIVETESDTIRIGGPTGSKAYRLATTQMRSIERTPIIEQTAVDRLSATLGIEEDL